MTIEQEQIQWREPGPRTRGPGTGGVWMDRLRPLLHHPGRWAMVYSADTAQKASGMAAALRGPKTARPAGKWEITSRGGEVFARYIGPE